MNTAVRDVGVAINWRVTLLGLNLAAWLVAALLVAALFVHREMAQPPLYPGFGYSIPMFNDLPTLYPTKVENEPVVGLQGIGRLRVGSAENQLNQVGLGQHKPLTPGQLGTPQRLSSPDVTRAVRDSPRRVAH